MRRKIQKAQCPAPLQIASQRHRQSHDHVDDEHSRTDLLGPLQPPQATRGYSLAPSHYSDPNPSSEGAATSPHIYITAEPTPPIGPPTPILARGAMHTHTSSSGSPITPNSATQLPFSGSTASLSLPHDANAVAGQGGDVSVGMMASASDGVLGYSGIGHAQGTRSLGQQFFDMSGDGPGQGQGGYISPPLSTGGSASGYFSLDPSYGGGQTLSLSGAPSPATGQPELVQQQQPSRPRQRGRGGRSTSASQGPSPSRHTSLPYPHTYPLASPPLGTGIGGSATGNEFNPSTGPVRHSRADSAGQSGEKPHRPTLHRTRTSQSSNGKDADREKAEASAKSAAKRASKACENCRLRRRKCSEQRPCKACVDIGLGASCTFRAKARPNRALPKVIDGNIGLDSLVLDPPLTMAQTCIVSPSSLGLSHAHPVRDIDATVELWLAEQGQPMSLALYDPPSLLASLRTRPLPPLLSPAAETHAVHSFLESTARYFAFLHGPRMLEMLRLHHATPAQHGFFVSQHQPDMASPGGLRPDERAMVYAAICLGRFKEIPPIQAGPGVQVAAASRDTSRTVYAQGQGQGQASAQSSANTLGMFPTLPTVSAGVKQEHKTVPLSVRLREMREDSGYFCRAILELEKWGGASLTALGALHCLHLFTLLSGGAAEMRDVLGRMAWQVREMGLHQADSAGGFAPEDRVDRLFYTTLHEDNWFATLLDAPPFILANTYDHSLTPSWDKESTDGERWIDQHPCVVQLTMFENELLTMIHTTPELSHAWLFDIEARLADWMKAFREEQLAVPSWMLHTYANIRFHWYGKSELTKRIRIMLRAPLLSNPHFRLASLSTVCRSSSQILLSYHSFADTASFLPTWGECRRILTCAHLVVLGHWEGEFLMTESEFLGGVALSLVERLEKGCPFMLGARERLELMFGLLGIAPRKPFGMGPPPPVDPPGPSPDGSLEQGMTQPPLQGSYSYGTGPFSQMQPQMQAHVTAAENAMGNYTIHYVNQQQQHLHQQRHGHMSQNGQVPLPQNPRMLPAHNAITQSLSTRQNSIFSDEPGNPLNAFGLTTGTRTASSMGLDQTIFLPAHGQQVFPPLDTAQTQLPHSHAGSPTGQEHDVVMSVAASYPTGAANTAGEQSSGQGVGGAIGMGADANIGAMGGAGVDVLDQVDMNEMGQVEEIRELAGAGTMDEDNEQPGWLDPWVDAMLWTGSDGQSGSGSIGMQVGEGDR